MTSLRSGIIPDARLEHGAAGATSSQIIPGGGGRRSCLGWRDLAFIQRKRISREARRAPAHQARIPQHVPTGAGAPIRGFGTLYRPDRGWPGQRVHCAAVTYRPGGPLGVEPRKRSDWRTAPNLIWRNDDTEFAPRMTSSYPRAGLPAAHSGRRFFAKNVPLGRASAKDAFLMNPPGICVDDVDCQLGSLVRFKATHVGCQILCEDHRI